MVGEGCNTSPQPGLMEDAGESFSRWKTVGFGLIGAGALAFEYGCCARLSNQQLEEVVFICAVHLL